MMANEFRRKWDRVYEFEEKGEFNSPEAKQAAQEAIATLPGHPCYWNDRFYVAVRFGLDPKFQREAAIRSVFTNGSIGYFESLSHRGFDMKKFLIELGVPEDALDRMPGPRVLAYHALPDDPRIYKTIAERFDIELGERGFLVR